MYIQNVVASGLLILVTTFAPKMAWASTDEVLYFEKAITGSLTALMEWIPKIDALVKQYGAKEERDQCARGLLQLESELRATLRTKNQLLEAIADGNPDRAKLSRIQEDFLRRSRRINAALELASPDNLSMRAMPPEARSAIVDDYEDFREKITKAFTQKGSAMVITLRAAFPEGNQVDLDKVRPAILETKATITSVLAQLHKIIIALGGEREAISSPNLRE